MANFSAKCSIMTQEMVDSFCESFYIPAEVHPTAPERGFHLQSFLWSFSNTSVCIFPNCYLLVRPGVLDLAPSVTLFRAFYTRSYSDGLFSFAKRSTSALTCFPKPPDSIKNWAGHFFWVDSRVFPISVPLYTGGILEKDPAPHLTTRLEQAVKLLESHKAPFRRYPECLLCLVGLSPYYPFDENSYPAFEYPDGMNGCYFPLDVVQAVEVQKGADQVKLLESTEHCFMPLVPRAPGGSSSAAGAEVSAPVEERLEDVAADDAYLELVGPGEDTVVAKRDEEGVVTEQPKKIKKKRLIKRSDVLPAKKLRTDHPSLASGTGGKTLAGLEQIMPAGSRLLAREPSATPSVAPPSQESESFVDLSAQASLQIRTTVGSSSTLSAPVDTAAATTTSTKAKLATDVNSGLAGPSQLEESKGSDDSFYELATLDPSEYVPRWNITNDSLLDGDFSCRTPVDRVAPPAFFSSLHSMDCDQLYTEFNVGAARQICLGSEVRSRAEHELELKEKLNAKCAARGKLLEEKDSEILRLKSQLAEKEAEAAEVIRLLDQVSSLSGEMSTLTAEVSALKVTITQKDNDISLLDSRATHLASSLDDAKVACAEAGTKITSLASERDRLASEDFKEKMEVQQEKQAQELYNRVAELEAHVMDVSGRLEGEFYPTYLTLLAG
ncbi:hypothetical protein Tco_0890522, partial [Tanacetum coccineum]